MSSDPISLGQSPVIIPRTPLCFLESLPYELLQEIFYWIRIISDVEDIPLLVTPPSRSLVSLVRRNLHHSLEIDLETLRKLAADCAGSTIELASYTKHLSITHKPMEGRKVAKIGGLLDFFKSATVLESLRIDDDNFISGALFSPRVVIHSHPALESLTIVHHHFGDTISLVQQFRYLALLPRLRSLDMQLHHRRTVVANEPTLMEGLDSMDEQVMVEAQAGGESSILAVVVFTDSDGTGHLDEIVLQSLTLGGDIENESVVELMKTIRSISSLSLSPRPYRVDLNKLLWAVDATNLNSLTISGESSMESQTILDPAIARFDDLESLTLPSDCHTPRLASAIAQLSKLESISFVYPSTPDFAALASILTLPTLPPSLKSITIPVPYFSRGAFHLEADYEPTYDFDGRVVPDPTWEPPIWPRRFTLDQAERLIGLARQAGVFLDSRLREVIQASREYEEEERWCIDQPIAEWGSGQGLVFG